MSAEKRRWVLSGGLASGKSTVRGFLEEHDITTIDADSVGHAVLQPGGPAFPEVARRWPDAVRRDEIDRKALGKLVFDDPGELADLETITHPYIFDRIRGQVEEIETVVVVVEIPLLRHDLDASWRRIVVDCEDRVRLQRAIDRGMSRDNAKARMAAQPSRAEWLACADAVLPNRSGLADLRSTVTKIVPKL